MQQHAVQARSAGMGALLPPLLALLMAASCTAPRPEIRLPREWVEVSFGGADRRQEQDDPVDDALAWGIGGGYDLLDGRPVRAGFEIGASYSRHDVAVILPEEPDPDLDVWRITLGGRLQLDLGRSVTLYGRGGGLWRSEQGEGLSGVSNDQLGTYWGAGLEWWYAPDATMGPFVLYTRGEEDGLEEWVFGLSARVYFDSRALDR